MAAKRVPKEPEPSGSTKDDILAIALAGGSTQAEAATKAGVSARTVSRRLDDPAFVALKNQYRRRMTDEAFGEIVKESRPAIKVLGKLLKDQDPRNQLAAAKAIGGLLVSIGSYHDLDERFAALEARVNSSIPAPTIHRPGA